MTLNLEAMEEFIIWNMTLLKLMTSVLKLNCIFLVELPLSLKSLVEILEMEMEMEIKINFIIVLFKKTLNLI